MWLATGNDGMNEKQVASKGFDKERRKSVHESRTTGDTSTSLTGKTSNSVFIHFWSGVSI